MGCRHRIGKALKLGLPKGISGRGFSYLRHLIDQASSRLHCSRRTHVRLATKFDRLERQYGTDAKLVCLSFGEHKVSCMMQNGV